jgi:hypothetical protein
LRVAAAGSFLVAAFDVLGGEEPNMLGSKREYDCSSQHIVMIAINGDFIRDRCDIPLGCLELSSLDLGIEGIWGFFYRVIYGQPGRRDRSEGPH